MSGKGRKPGAVADRLFEVADPDRAETAVGDPGLLSEADAALLDRSRTHWQMGEWDALAALADRSFEHHPDRARLSLLTAVGFAQIGDPDRARQHANRARDWGCGREIMARVLIGGAYNSLGRAAAMARDDDRAARFFEASIATVSPRADAQVLGRARDIHEKARMGLLPEAAKLMQAELAGLRAQGVRSDREKIFASQMETMLHELSLMQKRGQIGPAGAAGLPASRAAGQLEQDIWVLEQTGHKRGGFFVEFGATDGVLLSNTLILERDFGWTGICAEPNPGYFAQLQNNRSCIAAPDCILGESGRRVEFILADEYGGVAEFADADQHTERRDAYRREGHVIELESISLDAFLKKYKAPRRIDYLSIDTEGSEYDILSHFPFDAWDIRLITVEHNFSSTRAPLRALLSAQGYAVTEQKWDDWYVKTPAG